jgi:hypothetical protein
VRRPWPAGGCCAKRKKTFMWNIYNLLCKIIFPELRRYNYELLADYDALPVEILKTQDLPPYCIKRLI